MNHLLESARTSSTSVRATMFVGALVLGASALTGCGGDDCDGCNGPPGPEPSPSSSCVADAAPASAPAIVPGIVFPNGFGFSELPEGGVIEMQSGGQGGTHIDVGARAFVDAGPDATIEFEVESPDWGGSTLASLKSCNGEWSQVSGRIFDPPSGDVTLRITVLDAGGAEIAFSEMAAFVN